MCYPHPYRVKPGKSFPFSSTIVVDHHHPAGPFVACTMLNLEMDVSDKTGRRAKNHWLSSFANHRHHHPSNREPFLVSRALWTFMVPYSPSIVEGASAL